MFGARAFNPSDYEMVYQWWKNSNSSDPTPLREELPIGSSFIFLNKEPILFVALLGTNSPQFCFVENLVANPLATKQERRDAMRFASEYVDGWARRKGYKRLIALTQHKELASRYNTLGYGSHRERFFFMQKDI